MKKTIPGILILIFSFISIPLFSATIVWNGPSGGSWNTASNWNPQVVPTSGDDVVIPAMGNGYSTFIISGNGTSSTTFTVQTLTITAPTGTLETDITSVTVGPGITLQVNGKLILLSGSTSTSENSGQIAKLILSNLATLDARSDINYRIGRLDKPERAAIELLGASTLIQRSNIWLQVPFPANASGWDGPGGAGTLISSASSKVRIVGGFTQFLQVESNMIYNDIYLEVPENTTPANPIKYLRGSVHTANVTGKIFVTGVNIEFRSNTRVYHANKINYDDNVDLNYSITGVPVVFSGSNQKIALEYVDDLTIEGAGDKSLTRDVEVKKLTLTAGTVTTGVNNLIIKDPVVNALQYGGGYVIGNLRRYVLPGFYYPFYVGSSDLKLAEIRLNNSTNLDYLTVAYNASGSLSSPMEYQEQQTYFTEVLSGNWNINPNPGGASTSYNLRLYPGAFPSGGAFAVFNRSAPYDGSTPWSTAEGTINNDNNSPTGIQSGSMGSFVERIGMNAISNTTIGISANGTLPVDLAFFKVQSIEDFVQLDWATYSETKSSHFEIQRSRDAKNFETTGIVQSAGNSSEKIEYNYKDITATDILADKLYYRLKQVDVDGVFKIYPMQVVNVGDIIRNHKISIHPNPASEEVNVVSYLKENIQLQVFTPQGNKVSETEVGSEKIALNTSKYKQGVYVFKFISGSTVVNKKVIIQ